MVEQYKNSAPKMGKARRRREIMKSIFAWIVALSTIAFMAAGLFLSGHISAPPPPPVQNSN